jgi:hypothetical protein
MTAFDYSFQNQPLSEAEYAWIRRSIVSLPLPAQTDRQPAYHS